MQFCSKSAVVRLLNVDQLLLVRSLMESSKWAKSGLIDWQEAALWSQYQIRAFSRPPPGPPHHHHLLLGYMNVRSTFVQDEPTVLEGCWAVRGIGRGGQTQGSAQHPLNATDPECTVTGAPVLHIPCPFLAFASGNSKQRWQGKAPPSSFPPALHTSAFGLRWVCRGQVTGSRR